MDALEHKAMRPSTSFTGDLNERLGRALPNVGIARHEQQAAALAVHYTTGPCRGQPALDRSRRRLPYALPKLRRANDAGRKHRPKPSARNMDRGNR